MRFLMTALAILCLATPMAEAEDASKTDKNAPAVIAPIFSQLVMFTLPSGFTTISEQSSLDRYLREAVLKGETTDRWTQMITVTGAKSLAMHPNMSAQLLAAQISAGFQKACPATFSVKPLGPTTVSAQEAFVAIASCGKVDASAEKHSDTVLIVAIKGATDMYTVQWAERTPANAENLTIDEAKWKARLEKLSPMRVCAIVPNEKPPYPSCSSK